MAAAFIFPLWRFFSRLFDRHSMPAMTVVLMGLGLAPSSAESPPVLNDNADSIAVVIGEKTYKHTVGVDFADNDAKAMYDYLRNGLGFREANIIMVPDATRNDLEYEFGTDDHAEADLYNRVKAGRSNVFVYYSGHGVPDVATGRSFLLPSDGYPNSSGSGFALETLYRNLGAVKRKAGESRQVIVMIDACFTGESGKGDKLLEVSAPGFVPVRPKGGSGITKLLASSGTTPANWDRKNKLGLFTSRFLLGVAGLAAEKPGASSLPWSDLRKYVIDSVKDTARIEVRREQVPEIDEVALALPSAPPVAAVTTAIASMQDDANWRNAKTKGSKQAYEDYVGNCRPDACSHKVEALAALNAEADTALREADKKNWASLGKDQNYQAYLDSCIADHPCAYRDIAEGYLKLTHPKVAPPPQASPTANADEVDFKVATSLNRVEAYRDYMLHHPGGQYQDAALQAIRKLGDLDSKEKDQTLWIDAAGRAGPAAREAMQGYLARFPDGQHAAEARQRLKALEEQHEPPPERQEAYAPPAANPDTDASPFGGPQWLQGMDLPGNDLGPWVKGVNSTARCLAICQSTSGCIGFTYNSKRSVCIRKSYAGTPVASRDPAVSALLRSGSAPSSQRRPFVNYFPNLDAPYNDRGNWIYGATQASCENACISDSGCAGYTFNITKRVCILKNSIGRMERPRDRAVTAVVRR